MNRYVIISVVVLLPFCGLVAWGLTSLHEAPMPVAAPVPPAAPAPVAVVPAPVAPEPVAAAAAPAPPAAGPVAAARAAPVAAAPAPDAAPPAPQVPDAAARQAVEEQLKDVARDCFPAGGKRGPHNEVLSMFTVTPEGQLSDVRIKSHSRDPAIASCVRLALEKAHVDPSRGVPNSPMRHAFASKGR